MSKFEPVKQVIYVCWNDSAHAAGTHMWGGEPSKQDVIIACPKCGETVRITQKL